MYWHCYKKVDFGHRWDLKGKDFLFKKDIEIHTLFSDTYPSKPVVHHPLGRLIILFSRPIRNKIIHVWRTGISIQFMLILGRQHRFARKNAFKSWLH